MSVSAQEVTFPSVSSANISSALPSTVVIPSARAYSHPPPHTVLSDKRVDQFERIVRLLRSYCAHFERLNAILDGCPPEFYDSIMATVMQDPVVLPSNNRCDRSTVLRQLSVNPIDPFTKMPLSMDMVKPDDELKARIHAYMQQKLNELQNPAV